MSITIKESIALVTGANRGIGKAIVEQLIDQGAAKIYACARNKDSLQPLVEGHADKIIALELDVTNETHIQQAAKQAGDVNIVINNAGILNYTAIVAAADTNSAREEMEVNYFGLLNMTRAFAPILKTNGPGAFVNISSIGGLFGIPMLGTYCASKAAVHSLTQSVRGELASQGILVIGVYPGPIDTHMTKDIDMEKETPTQVAKAILKGIQNGIEDVYPDKVSQETAVGLQADSKAVEKQWAEMLPQPA